MRFRPQDRIRKREDFRRCHAEGRRYYSPHFVLIHRRKPTDGPARLGMAVSRKTGGAVVRNRWKRLIRECFRTDDHRERCRADHVVIVRKSIQGAPPPNCRDELRALFSRATTQ